MFRLLRFGGKIIYLSEPCFSINPRRLLGNPFEFFKIKAYDELHQLKDYRRLDIKKQYKIINQITDKIDLEPIQRYIIEYYILLPCIFNTNLIKKIKSEVKLKKNLERKIIAFWGNAVLKNSEEIFAFSRQLCYEYFEQLIKAF